MTTFLLVSIGLQLSGPWIVRAFIDGITVGVQTQVLIRLALWLISVTVIGQIVKVLATYWSERVAWTASNALRIDMVAHLLNQDAHFHKEHTPGEMIERIDGDISALATFFSTFVVQLVGSLLLLGGAILSLFLVHRLVGLAFAAFSLVAITILMRVRKIATPFVQETRERSALFYGYVGEAITAAEDIRTSGAVPYAMHRFSDHLRHWKPWYVLAETRGAVVWAVAVLAFAMSEALAYGLGGGLFRYGAIPLSAVYMTVQYAALLAHPIEMIRTQLQSLQRADASIARILQIFSVTPTIVDGTTPLPPGPLSVALQSVCFQYPDEAGAQENVLDNLTLQLAPGRRLGLLGQTGSGKTTIARLLFRLYDPTEGEVQLGGVNLRNAQRKEIRSRVGLVTQEVQLFEATLRDNITFFDPTISDQRLLSVLETLGLIPWLERLAQGLDTSISAGTLSAGEAQLLAFARVFLYDPGLIILDEASSRLDPATEVMIDHAVQRLLAGRTAIIIAHRLATVEQVDDILILQGGQVLEHGSREGLAATPTSRFAELRRMGYGEVLS
jgi:ATP-binding cassette subfamily B protein